MEFTAHLDLTWWIVLWLGLGTALFAAVVLLGITGIGREIVRIIRS